MVLFLLLVIAAIALEIVGVAVKGMFYLLIIGIHRDPRGPRPARGPDGP
jgi:hypothetical protein